MNLPNKITIVRILLIPIFITLFFLDGVFLSARLVAAGVFILAAATDFLDGYIARKYNLVTDLGKFLDSIADKIVVISALLMLVFARVCGNDILDLLVFVFTAVIIVRELLISALRQIAAVKNVVIAADIYGKIKTAVQLTAIPFLIACTFLDPYLRGAGLNFDLFMLIGFILLAISTLLALLSGAHYLIKNRGVFLDK